ncbi:hypothetical protein BDK51DRAFT_42984, partial [Blyttiomyces helicus]
MDDIVKIAFGEIALEGEFGCTVDRMWELILARKDEIGSPDVDVMATTGESATCAGGGVFDQDMKEWIWQSIRSSRLVEFLIRPDGRAPALPKMSKADLKRKARESQAPTDQPPGPSREEVGSMTLGDIAAKYGNTLRIRAPEDARRLAIVGQNDRTVKLSPVLYLVIAAISRYRSAGITQATLSKELSIDPRSLFHYLKTLMGLKLIVKFPVVTDGTYTNLCVHTRFAVMNKAYQAYIKKARALIGGDDDGDAPFRPNLDEQNAAVGGMRGNTGVSFHGEIIKQKVTTLLAAAKNKVMVVQDLMDALDMKTKSSLSFERKWFNRLIESLVKANYIERVNVPKKPAGESLNTRGYDRCVRLLRVFQPVGLSAGPAGAAAKAAKPSAGKQAAADPDHDLVLGEGGVLVDLPFEWQVYRIIALAGDRGVTAGTIARSLNNTGQRLLNKILSRLTKSPSDDPSVVGASRIAEFVGRERRYRYYSFDAFNRLYEGGSHQRADIDTLGLMVPSLASGGGRPGAEGLGPTGGRTKVKDREDAPVEGICKVCSQSNDLNSPLPAPLISCESCGNVYHTLCAVTSSAGVYFCSQACCEAGPREVGVGPTPMDLVPPTPRPGVSSCKYRVHGDASTPSKIVLNRSSITAVRRRNNLLALLEERKILEVGHLLVKAYQDLVAAQEGGAAPVHTVDKKTLQRTAVALEREKLLSIYTVSLPLLNGSYSPKVLFLHPSLNPKSPEVLDYVDMMHDRNLLIGGKTRATKVEVDADLEVERLDDMQRRMQGAGGESSMMGVQVQDEGVAEQSQQQPGWGGVLRSNEMEAANQLSGMAGMAAALGPAGLQAAEGMISLGMMGAMVAGAGPDGGAAPTMQQIQMAQMQHMHMQMQASMMMAPARYDPTQGYPAALYAPEAFAPGFVGGAQPMAYLPPTPAAPPPMFRAAHEAYLPADAPVPIDEDADHDPSEPQVTKPRPTGLSRRERKKRQLSERSNPQSEVWWLNVAQSYGYINAKMIRAKLLHEWL